MYAYQNPTAWVDPDGNRACAANEFASDCDSGTGFKNLKSQESHQTHDQIAQRQHDEQSAIDSAAVYSETPNSEVNPEIRARIERDLRSDAVVSVEDKSGAGTNTLGQSNPSLVEAAEKTGELVAKIGDVATGIVNPLKGGHDLYEAGKNLSSEEFEEFKKLVDENPEIAATALAAMVVSKGKGSQFNRKEITRGFQDHHIISDKNVLTKNHELLELAGFDLQKRSNKIFLPSVAPLHSKRSIHRGRHTNAVSENLANQMDQVVEVGMQQGWSKEQYRKALDSIIAQERALLKSGERALNKNARPGAK